MVSGDIPWDIRAKNDSVLSESNGEKNGGNCGNCLIYLFKKQE